MVDLKGQTLVETDWLAANLGADGLVVVDCTWYPPSKERDPAAEFLKARIPGAIFYDPLEIRDKSSDLPHMIPPPDEFSNHMRNLGITNSDTVILYDTKGVWTATRGWWVFTIMGHKNVAVLNGGLPKWQAEGRQIESGKPKQRPLTLYNPDYQKHLVLTKEEMARVVEDRSRVIVDARGPAGFTGNVENPDPNERHGHVPGARNVPDDDVVTEQGTLKTGEELAAVFAGAGVDVNRPIAMMCLTGMTASLVGFALVNAGHRDVVQYDGCWKEWQADHALPIEQGEAV